MTLYTFLTGLSLMLLPAGSFGQEQKIYKSILRDKKVGKVYLSVTYYDSTRRMYLGALQDENKKDVYYVIRAFKKVRAATWRGYSYLYFYNLKLKKVAYVHVSLPDDLPYKLEGNTFFFKHTENGRIKNYTMTLQVPLPEKFCSGENQCETICFD